MTTVIKAVTLIAFHPFFNIHPLLTLTQSVCHEGQGKIFKIVCSQMKEMFTELVKALQHKVTIRAYEWPCYIGISITCFWRILVMSLSMKGDF